MNDPGYGDILVQEVRKEQRAERKKQREANGERITLSDILAPLLDRLS
jgi:hypothetical protein